MIRIRGARFFCLAIAVSGFLTLSGVRGARGQEPDGLGNPFGAPETSVPWGTGASALNDEAERALATVVDGFVYQDVPFSEVLADLRKRYGVNCLLDTSAKEDALVEETTVNANLRGLPLEVCLKELLYSHNATLMVRDGIVVFISKDVASDTEYLELKVFDCTELAKRIPLRLADRFPPRADVNASIVPVVGGGMFSQQAGAGQDTDGAKGEGAKPAMVLLAAPSREMTSLEELVSRMVQPDTWSRTGNGDSELYEVDGKLIVTAPRSTVRQVAGFLAALERAWGISQ